MHSCDSLFFVLGLFMKVDDVCVRSVSNGEGKRFRVVSMDTMPKSWGCNSGDVFNRLTVIYVSPIRKRFFHKKSTTVERVALCRCICGVEKYIRVRYLVDGRTKSCGCLRKETMKLNQKKCPAALKSKKDQTALE